MDAKKIGLFLIKQILFNNINYEFKLSFGQHIQPIFHIFFLKKTYPETLLQTIFYHQNNKTTEYELKKIMDCFKGMYLIYWKRYLNSKNT